MSKDDKTLNIEVILVGCVMSKDDNTVKHTDFIFNFAISKYLKAKKLPKSIQRLWLHYLLFCVYLVYIFICSATKANMSHAMLFYWPGWFNRSLMALKIISVEGSGLVLKYFSMAVAMTENSPCVTKVTVSRSMISLTVTEVSVS